MYSWMSTFYRRPHPEYIPAAFLECLRSQGGGGGLRGKGSLSSAVFLASLLSRGCRSEAEVDGVVSACVGALAEAYPGGGRGVGEEELDTLLRALGLANSPPCDAVLGRLVGAWRVDMERGWSATGAGCGPPGWENASKEDVVALVSSLEPRAPPRTRTPFLQWPIPTVNLSMFERTLKLEPFPVYGATRYLFSRTWAMHTLGRAVQSGQATPQQAATFPVLSPTLASEVTCLMVDAYWGVFYATGEGGPVERVMDVATGYWEFVDEFGMEPVLQYPSSPLPPELTDTPYVAMRFQASRHALWSLLWHAQRHTAVGDHYTSSLKQLNDRAALSEEEGGEGEGLTKFGRDRLDLLLYIKPTMQALTALAWEKGVGSGQWPTTYALLHTQDPLERLVMGEDGKLALPLTTNNTANNLLPPPQSLLSTLPATESVRMEGEGGGGVGGRVPLLSTPVPLQSRDQRTSKLKRRKLE